MYLFPMVQTFVVVLQRWYAYLCALYVVGIGVDNVACKKLLPEREAAGRACGTVSGYTELIRLRRGGARWL